MKAFQTVVCIIGISFAALAVGETRSLPVEGKWATALGERTWTFPEDHGAHGEFRTEWWYFTGSLVSGASDYSGGYQLTFFRTGLAEQPAVPGNPWSVRDLYFAHFALTDAPGNQFYWTERASRAGPGLAGARDGALEVWLHGWKAVQSDGSIHLQARSGLTSLDVTLVPLKPPVLHGEGGLSLKGEGPGQASWYYSMTALKTTGTISLPDRSAIEVEGKSWFDHEFGSNQLADDQAGWDWFGLQLSNGSEIMIYILRNSDGSVEPVSSGTLIFSDGSSVQLAREDFSIQAAGKWKSKASGATYPSGWRIAIPGEDIEIRITPVLREQELTTRSAAGITYWEGAVAVEGRAGAEKVTGGGYVELTGYAGSMGGIF